MRRTAIQSCCALVLLGALTGCGEPKRKTPEQALAPWRQERHALRLRPAPQPKAKKPKTRKRAVTRPHGPVVKEEPPAPKKETIPPKPGPDFMWVPGRWVWNGRYVWQKGYWYIHPKGGAKFREGGWEKTDDGWVYKKGEWSTK